MEKILYIDTNFAEYCIQGMAVSNEKREAPCVWIGAPIFPIEICDFFRDFGERYHMYEVNYWN
jgi:hypothetical protein